MIRRHFLVGALLATLAPVCVADEAPAPRLNVLVIVSDDLNCELGCYGNTTVRTPNIDRLAARGVRFDNAYCNYPVCNASRASFLSGRYPETSGVYSNGVSPRLKLGDGVRFMPEHFHDHGYFTASVGKVSHDEFAPVVSWDVRESPPYVPGGADPSLFGDKASVKPVSPANASGGTSEVMDETEHDGIVARRVAELISEPREKPFFIAVGFHKPHNPQRAPKRYFDMYELATIPLPDSRRSPRDGIPSIAFPPQVFADASDEEMRKQIRARYATISFMDAQLGLVLDALEATDHWKDTVVFFFSDHGYHHYEHGGFWAKQSTMQESARVPLVVAAPGVAGGKVTNGLVELIDIFPTAADLCGVPAAEGAQGSSFAPLLAHPEGEGKPYVLTVVRRLDEGSQKLGRSLRDGRFNYTEWPDGSRQLYDARRDPLEMVNLADDLEHAEVVSELHHALRDFPSRADR